MRQQLRPRCFLPADRLRLANRLKSEADGKRFNALRNRALVLLAWTSGLRLGECMSLTVAQLLDNPKAVRVLRIRSQGYLRVEQAKGGAELEPGSPTRTWTSAGVFIVTKTARRALQLYLQSAQKSGVMKFPVDPDQRLWVQKKTGRPLRTRTIQYQFQTLLQRAGVPERYRFHDLRHDALTRFSEACGGDVFKVAAFGRCDPYTAQRYVHASPFALSEFADKAAARMMR